MQLLKINLGNSEITPQGVCANGGVCPNPTTSQCKEAGYAGQTQWYATYIVQKRVGGLDFKG